jgi:hypothetical protein
LNRTPFAGRIAEKVVSVFEWPWLPSRRPVDFHTQEEVAETRPRPPRPGTGEVSRPQGRYTHRVAISNHRLRAFDGERVTFQWKDYAHENQSRLMTLSAMEFLRRFIQHVLPRGFVRIRYFGYLAPACRTARLALARTLLAQPVPARLDDTVDPPAPRWVCPQCGGPLRRGPQLTARQLAVLSAFGDTS